MPSLIRWTLAAASLFVFSIPAACAYRIPRADVPPSNATGVSDSSSSTYTNPVLQGAHADPWVTKIGSYYYLMVSSGTTLQVRKSTSVTNFNVPSVQVWKPTTSTQKDVWAPELHQIDGQFYIYAAMDDGNNDNHRMYVWKGTSTTDPTQPFDLVGQLGTSDNNWAIDGTVFQSPNGANYFIWSGWSGTPGPYQQNLYIAAMSSPTSLTGDRVLIHSATPAWQAHINEGPEILMANGRVFLLYSAAGSWTADYSIAMMGLNSQADDPLNVKNWWSLDDRPVMQQSDKTHVYGTGHASYTTAPDGTPMIVYHAMDTAKGGWGGRSVRAEAFGWNEDGSPRLPTPPTGAGVEIQNP